MRGLILWLSIVAASVAGFAICGSHEPPAPPPASALRAEPDSSATAVADAISRGLRYLALTQRPKGCWLGDVGHKQMDRYIVYFEREREAELNQGNVGVTAIAGLAFLAGGHAPGRGPHGKLLERTLRYVLECTSGHSGPDGYIQDSDTRMYEHAFATLFLSQIYGMSHGRASGVGQRLKAAVDLIVDCQTETGGWRYGPYTNECDLSVTVCEVQALRAARDAGIPVRRSCIDRVVEYLKNSQITYGYQRGLFWYKITGTSAMTKTSFTINAAAVTALHSAGLYNDQSYGRAVEYLESEYDEISRFYGTHFYFWYGNYYAAQAFYQCGGTRWERYWKRLQHDLLSRQQSDGRWRNDTGPGDEFATAMACLILQIPDGCLPIFQR